MCGTEKSSRKSTVIKVDNYNLENLATELNDYLNQILEW